MAEGAPLLREYGLKAHRGFESLPLRHTVWSLIAVSVTILELHKNSGIYPICWIELPPANVTKVLEIWR